MKILMADKKINRPKDKKQAEKQNKKKFRPEYVAYAVLGLVVAAIIVLVVIIFVSSSGSGSSNFVLPCCR